MTASLERLSANPLARSALIVVAVAAVGFSVWRWHSEPVSSSVFPRLSQEEFLASQRKNPIQVLTSLSGQCGGDWRRLSEPARHVFASLLFEIRGAQPDNPAAPTAEEVVAAYAALGVPQPGSDRGPAAIAREAYITANAGAFGFVP